MTQDQTKEVSTVELETSNDNDDQGKLKKNKDGPLTKVVLRRLPPTLTLDVLLEQISPVPDHDYLHFVRGDPSLGANAFSRAYINFTDPEDIIIFRDKFDDYVFVDAKGNEYSAIVEYAPYQKVPKRKTKRDSKKGTLEQDADYIKFVEGLSKEEDEGITPPDAMLEEIEAKQREMAANHGCRKVTTPLIEFVKKKREERRAAFQKVKENKKFRELEKRKAKEDEKKKRKEKEWEQRQRDRKARIERDSEKDSESSEIEKTPSTPIKLLQNPERAQEKEKEAERGKEKGDVEPVKALLPNKDVRPRTGKDQLGEKSGRDGKYERDYEDRNAETRRERGGYREKRERDQERRRQRKDNKKPSEKRWEEKDEKKYEKKWSDDKKDGKAKDDRYYEKIDARGPKSADKEKTYAKDDKYYGKEDKFYGKDDKYYGKDAKISGKEDRYSEKKISTMGRKISIMEKKISIMGRKISIMGKKIGTMGRKRERTIVIMTKEKRNIMTKKEMTKNMRKQIRNGKKTITKSPNRKKKTLKKPQRSPKKKIWINQAVCLKQKMLMLNQQKAKLIRSLL